jgi:parvulin-like peptidyl-prolyl isomerase
MARRDRQPEQPKELTRKQAHQHARDRERNRKLIIGTSIAVGVALLVVLVGLINEFAIKPSSTLAKVDDQPIVTRDFWKRARLERAQLLAQLNQYQQLERQFGGQGFFTNQINQIGALLASPFSLGMQVLDTMIEEKVVATAASARGLAVTDEEIDVALREEIAAGEGAVTIAQATATAEADAAATATAGSWTPTPTPTIDALAVITATATAQPTPEPQPTRPVLTDSQFDEGVTSLQDNLQQIAGMSLAEYRTVIGARLLSEKLAEVIGGEAITRTTEEQVHASHILIRIDPPAPSPTPLAEGEATAVPTPVPLDESASPETTATPLAEGEATAAPTPVPSDESASPETTATPVAEGEPTAAPTPAVRDDAAALALAQELRQRLVDGEEFAALAAEYSDDPGSAMSGGDLGWFSRGRMVPEFEEAAFSLAPGEISEPVRTDFGYHIIQVIERDDNRPRDEATLEQERRLAFQDWLRLQVAASTVERPDDLAAKLPADLSDPVQLTAEEPASQ